MCNSWISHEQIKFGQYWMTVSSALITQNSDTGHNQTKKQQECSHYS